MVMNLWVPESAGSPRLNKVLLTSQEIFCYLELLVVFIVQLSSGILYVGAKSLNKIMCIHFDKKNGL